MTDILIPVSLMLVYGLGYYIIFLGGPTLVSKVFPRGAAHLVTYAQRKFPRLQGIDTIQFLIATRLGMVGCIGTTAFIAVRLLTK